MASSKQELLTVGWREWLSLPKLGLTHIKAKVDTGARTSSLHAFELRDFMEAGVHKVEFKMHPNQLDEDTVAVCVADIVDTRLVRDSGGHQEERWIIESPVCIGANTWNIEINLTSRDDMRFRMLLGRTALRGHALVDPARSYVVGKRPAKKKRKDK
ncbi:MAG: ATP-dependent zinc protease [Gammaproteobacteria bacterium]